MKALNLGAIIIITLVKNSFLLASMIDKFIIAHQRILVSVGELKHAETTLRRLGNISSHTIYCSIWRCEEKQV